MSVVTTRSAPSQKVAVSVMFVLTMFISIMDTTIVNVAMPRIGRDFDVQPTAVAAISIAYLVSLATVIPVSGWIGDRFGGKRVLVTAMVIFTAASVLCGLAGSFRELVCFRVLQGIGGGLLTPVAMAMLYRVFPAAERVRVASLLVIPTGLAPAAGPVLGGFLVGTLSWRWVFLVNLPFGVAAVVFGIAFLRDDPELRHSGPFDVRGFLLAATGLGLLMYGLSEGPQLGWRDGVVLPATVVGVFLVGGLIVAEFRTDHPLLDLSLFQDRLFRSASLCMFVATIAFVGTLYAFALFAQDGLGLSAFRSGLITLPESLGVMSGAQLASRLLYPRIGPRRMMATGLAVAALILCAMSTIQTAGEVWLMAALMFLLGFAMSQNFVPTQAAAMARMSAARMGQASTMMSAFRQLGGAVGVAVLTTVMTAGGVNRSTSARPSLTGYHAAFLAAAGVILIAALIALTVHDADASSTRPGRNAKPEVHPSDADGAVGGVTGVELNAAITGSVGQSLVVDH